MASDERNEEEEFCAMMEQVGVCLGLLATVAAGVYASGEARDQLPMEFRELGGHIYDWVEGKS